MESLDLTHSAVSQTVAALRAEGLVVTVPGPDARTRVVELTERAKELVALASGGLACAAVVGLLALHNGPCAPSASGPTRCARR